MVSIRYAQLFLLSALRALAAAETYAGTIASDLRSTTTTGTGRRNSTRIRTGVRYPHSSTRQQARYARQIAAGQLNMAGCRKGGAA
jgi:hypothetical protein